MTVPKGYVHKATSENFTQTEKVVIYHNRVEDLYLLVVEMEADEQGWYFTKEQLRLIVHAGTDVLDNSKV